MNVLLEILLTNAVVVVILAIVIYLVTRIYRNSFAVHFLWLIVLVKLVTPPILSIPIPVLAAETNLSMAETAQTGDLPSEIDRASAAHRFVGDSDTKERSRIAGDDNEPRPGGAGEPYVSQVSEPSRGNVLEDGGLKDGDQAESVRNPEVASSRARFPFFSVLSEGLATSVGLVFWMATLWMLGTVVLITITVYRLVAFDRLLRQTTEVSELWQTRVEQLAKRIGISRAPWVRTTAAKISPLIWCVRRTPVLVLPVQLMDSLDEKQADQIIVHELAHLLRRSHCIRWFELFVTSVYWWHPVLWWARHQVRQADEACCDSIVLKHFPGDSHGYGLSLLRSAEFVSGNSKQASLAFSFSEFKFLKRRMQMVLENEPSTISKTSKSMLAVVGCLFLILSARGYAGSNAASVQVTSIESPDSLTLFVMDPSDEPVAGVSVKTKVGDTEKSFQTDASGKCDIGYSGDVPELGLTITVRADGYVPMSSVWRTRDQQSLPDSLEFKLQRPSSMGGIVVDTAGKPIAGVGVTFAASTQAADGTHIYTTSLRVSVETDQDGRWKCDQVPPFEQLATVWATFSSDGTVAELNRFDEADWGLLRDQEYKQTLKTGYSIRGRVTDAAGTPIHGAHCVVGQGDQTLAPRFSETNMDGEYVSTGVESGERIVTILADGYAPMMHPVAVINQDANQDFELVAGEPIVIEVNDPAGNPVAGARVSVVDWKGNRSLHQLLMYHSPLITGPDGILKWENAPPEPVDCFISAKGYATIHRRTISSNGSPYQFVLYPPLQVAVKVIDKKTQAPVKKFSVMPGMKDSNGGWNWSSNEAVSGSDGELTWKRGSVVATTSDTETFFRIQANGHQDVVSRGVRQHEGNVELVIEMEPAKTRTVSLIAPDGNLATQAKAFVCRGTGGSLYLRNGATFDHEDRHTRLVVRDGKLELPTEAEDFSVVVCAEEGYRAIEASELESANRIQLLAWSRIEGVAMIGSEPAAGETIKISFQFLLKDGFLINYAAQADKDGKFVFTRVPPDLVNPHVYREIITFREGNLGNSTSASVQSIALKPGETTTVNLGGQGRPVIGKLLPPADYGKPIAQWNHFGGTIKLERTIAVPGNEVKKEYHGAVIQTDGTFRFEDVPAGQYRFETVVREKNENERKWPPAPIIGSASRDFVIEPMAGGRSDKPLDLGELRLK